MQTLLMIFPVSYLQLYYHSRSRGATASLSFICKSQVVLISGFVTVAGAISSAKVASIIMEIPTFLSAEVRKIRSRTCVRALESFSPEACSFSILETLLGSHLLRNQAVVMEAGGVVMSVLGFPPKGLGGSVVIGLHLSHVHKAKSCWEWAQLMPGGLKQSYPGHREGVASRSRV